MFDSFRPSYYNDIHDSCGDVSFLYNLYSSNHLVKISESNALFS